MNYSATWALSKICETLMDNSCTYCIGDLIRLIDERNYDGSIHHLMGLTISKKYIPSVANTNGTDLSNYKIIRKGRFACSLMQVSRDGKFPVALYNNSEPSIMSPAYPMFEVLDINVLLPEYLMLWFMRPEFDREACFYAVGGVRGSLEWDDFCKMKVPVPDISIQKEIVSESQSLSARYVNNERLISELEVLGDTLFKERISNYLDVESRPEGWHISNLPGIASFLNGLACQKYEPDGDEPVYPVIKIREMGLGKTDELSDVVSMNVPDKYIIKRGDLLFSWSASLVVDVWSADDGVLNQHIFKVSPTNVPRWFCYYWIRHYLNQWNHYISAKATSMGHLKQEDLSNAKVVIPNLDNIHSIGKEISPVFNLMCSLKREQVVLSEIQKSFLYKLSKC